ncbi:MAG: hypothetical protein JXR65_04220 [Bacteroidales bacterium]|nr:hypothetical protein [Bacteroidales bacterium]
MDTFSNRLTVFKRAMLFVLPAVYLLAGFYFRQIFGDLSLRSVDPDYMHLISGLSVSFGKFSQANIDHPASVLHLLLALVFRLVYFFRPHTLSYFDDVISNSDLYLSVANLVITAIISFSLFWSGKMIEKISGNIVYALMIQLSPFLFPIWYDIFGRVYTELLFVVPVLMIVVLLFSEFYPGKDVFRNKTITYGISIGLGLSLKMIFFPFFFLPFFVLKKRSEYLKYLLSVLVSFSILSVPVLVQFNRFFGWMKSIFLHSGSYESGAQTIINTTLFTANFQRLFSAYPLVVITIGVLVVALLAQLIRKRGTRLMMSIDLGVLVVLGLFTFLLSKNFGERYFIPVWLMFPFLLILLLKNIEVFIKKTWVKSLILILLLWIMGTRLVQTIPYMRLVSVNVESQMEARKQTRAVLRTLPANRYKIIVSQDYGSPLQEYAVMYGFCMAGRNGVDYRSDLSKLYPDTYQYFTWDNTLKYWGAPFDPEKIIKSGKSVYLYLEKNTEELYNRTIHKLFEDFPGYSVQRELIFENQVNHEAVYQLVFEREGKMRSDKSP